MKSKTLVTVFLLFTSILLVQAKKYEIPRGFENPMSKESYEEIINGKELVLIFTSPNLWNTWGKLASSVEKAEKGLKEIERELGDTHTLLYWVGSHYKEMSKIIPRAASNGILKQNAHNTISSVVLDVATGKVLLSGDLCRYKEKSSKVNRESVEKFILEVQKLSTDGEEESEEGKENPLVVESQNGKTLEITPLKIAGNKLTYLFSGKEHKIELSRLTEESVTKVKEFLK